LRPIRKNAKHFFGRKKNVAEQNTTKGASPTGVLRSLAAVRRRTVTVLLCAGFCFYFPIISYLLFILIFQDRSPLYNKSIKQRKNSTIILKLNINLMQRFNQRLKRSINLMQ
jgi:hypothetical protein